MDDIVGLGRDREPPRWRGRSIAAGIVALVAAAVLAHLPRSTGVRDGRTAPSSTAPYGSGSSAAPVSRALRLLLGGARPAWMWPATGRLVPIGGLPPNPTGYQLTEIGGGWAVQADPTAPAGCQGYCAGAPLPVYYLASGARSAVRVGSATSVAPGATRGTMWLTNYRPGSDLSSSRGTAREVTGSGNVLGRAIRLPAGYQIARGTAAGLLLTAENGPTATYELWNPARGRPMKRLRHVVALSAAQIASAQPGGIRVVNLRTSRVRTIRIPASGSAIDGTFSPDGRYLALLIGFGIRIGVGGALAIRLEVTAAIGDRVVVIPPASAWSGDLAGYGWAAGSDILVTELGIGNFMGVTSWQPGTGRLGEATLVPDAVTAGLVTG